jgi:WD40 repeat protein
MLAWHAHNGLVTSLAFVPGGGLLSTGTDGVLKHWDALTGSLQYFWKFAETAATPAECDLVRVLADATGRFAAVGLRNEGISFIDLADGSEADRFRLRQLLGMAPAPDGASVFVVGPPPPRVGLFSRQSKVFQHAYPPGKVIASSKIEVKSGTLVIRRDGTQVIAGGIRFGWPSGVRIETALVYPSGNQFEVSADGDKLFGLSGNRLVVWGFQIGVVRQRLKGHIAPITGLTATPDGRKLWTAALDATVRQWDVETYGCDKCYGLKIGPLGCVAVSADGLTAAAGSAHNGHIAVWDLD